MSMAASRNILEYFLMKMFLIINAFYFKIVKPPAASLRFFTVLHLKKLYGLGLILDSVPGSAAGILSEEDQATVFQL